jgi:S-methylmethionine-dependent homocysteine/selenocysteine methylase
LPELTSDELGPGALALFAAGATAVGGCCGAGPAAIAAARAALDSSPSSLDELPVD